MKHLLLISLLVTILTAKGLIMNDINEIKETIRLFSEAGDKNDTEKLTTYLDENYRIVMNRLFGSNTVNIMPKKVYLEKIKSKEFGGDIRTLTITNVLVNGNTASAKVKFEGQKSTYTSLVNLVKSETGKWKLISDTPVFQ